MDLLAAVRSPSDSSHAGHGRRQGHARSRATLLGLVAARSTGYARRALMEAPVLDPRILADDPELVKTHLLRRNADASLIASVDRLVDLRDARNALVAEGDELRAARNTLSKKIGGLMREGKRDEAEAIKAQVAAGKDRIAAIDAELGTLEGERANLSMAIPNLLHDDVPFGDGDEDNVEVRRWGSPRPDTTESHVEIAEKLGILDVDRSTKL